jgi:cytochrome c-type biogenesis protein CcmH/NrfG
MTRGPKKTPVTPGEWNALGRYLYQKRMFELAVGAFRVAVRAHPHSQVFQENLGIALLEMGEPAQALKHLKKALAIEPSSFKVLYYLGMAYAKQKDFAKAREFYQRVLEFTTDHHWQGLAQEKLSFLELGVTDSLEYSDFMFKQILDKNRE